MPGYILTGGPGAGKTAVLRLLEVTGHVVVEEAATNVIAVDNALGVEEPWHDHVFIDAPPNRRANSTADESSCKAAACHAPRG